MYLKKSKCDKCGKSVPQTSLVKNRGGSFKISLSREISKPIKYLCRDCDNKLAKFNPLRAKKGFRQR